MVLPSVNNSSSNICTRTCMLMICCTKRSVTMVVMTITCLLYLWLVTRHDPASLNDQSRLVGVSEPVRLREDGFRLCQALTAEGEALTVGQPMHQVPKLMAPMGLPFQCAGSPYEEFGQRLQALLQQHASSAPPSDHWGKRAMPILPHSPTKTRVVPPPTFVLFMGTMHLRQVVSALLCQYSHRIRSAKRIYSSKRTSIGSFSIQVILHDNIHIFVVLNPPFVYDHDNWQDLLERHILNMPLAVMDLIVMSQFHTFSEQLGIAFEEFWMDHENDWTVPDMVHENPISFVDLLLPSDHTEGAIVYEGPMIYVSLFAPHGREEYYHVEKTILALAALPKGGADADSITLPPDPRDLNKLQRLEHDYEKLQQQQPPPPDQQNQGQQQQQQQQLGLPEEAQDRLTYKASPPKFHQGGGGRGDGGGGGHRHRRQLRSLKKKTKPLNNSTRTISKTASLHLSRRTNLAVIDGRKYTRTLGECATDKGDTVGTCLTDPNDPRYETGARCFGALGSHADLVAWDLVEAIYKVMWNK